MQNSQVKQIAEELVFKFETRTDLSDCELLIDQVFSVLFYTIWVSKFSVSTERNEETKFIRVLFSGHSDRRRDVLISQVLHELDIESERKKIQPNLETSHEIISSSNSACSDVAIRDLVVKGRRQHVITSRLVRGKWPIAALHDLNQLPIIQKKRYSYH